VENLGNTEITDVTGQIDIYNKNETVIIKSLTFGKLKDPVSPDDVVRTSVTFDDLKLDPGEYWVVAKIFKDSKVIYENRLYQKINEEPVQTPESPTVKKPGIPKPATDTTVKQDTPVTSETPLRDAAPDTEKNNNFIIIIGFAGLGFGLIVMVAIIVLLVILIKNQRQAMIQRYLADQKKL